MIDAIAVPAVRSAGGYLLAHPTKYFCTMPEFWMNMQAGFNLKTEEVALHGELELFPDRAA
ncbi:hypothetical protein N183_33985 [Sinorhizobium sp. Sb3]|nr:hypothetical protein N183_33985 [Sinorhizobium sp. Sb3]